MVDQSERTQVGQPPAQLRQLERGARLQARGSRSQPWSLTQPSDQNTEAVGRGRNSASSRRPLDRTVTLHSGVSEGSPQDLGWNAPVHPFPFGWNNPGAQRLQCGPEGAFPASCGFAIRRLSLLCFLTITPPNTWSPVQVRVLRCGGLGLQHIFFGVRHSSTHHRGQMLK